MRRIKSQEEKGDLEGNGGVSPGADEIHPEVGKRAFDG